MRMWKVPPEILCTKHLSGEHVEMHMFMGSLQKGISLKGYIRDGLVEVHNIEARHDELAREMALRGWNHRSPAYEDVPYYEAGYVNVEDSIEELRKRCYACRRREAWQTNQSKRLST